MVFSESINYPNSFDSNSNLYEVHDGLRVVLAEDYNPGDTSISIISNVETMDLFSDTGIITLTDQCNDIESRGLSFYYGSKTTSSFDDLELLPGFVDASKPKNLTSVTQNVMAVHHNCIKDSIIAIQQFVGKDNEEAKKPLEGTMQQRTRYIRNIAFDPKAWFIVSKRVGVVPLIVQFKSLGVNLGIDKQVTNTLEQIWDFGDEIQLIVNQRWNADLINQKVTLLLKGQTDTSDLIKVRQDIIWSPKTDASFPTQNMSITIPDYRTGFDATINIKVDLDATGSITVTKDYVLPTICDVSLEVINDYGRDYINFPNLISCKFTSPDLATIKVTDVAENTSQILSNPAFNSYLRLGSSKLIDLTILDDGSHFDDPVVSYTWSIFDDLSHGNSASTKAVYSLGGLYDVVLRADTNLKSYRITSYKNAIDIVEKYNLWLWNYKLDGSTTNFGEVEPMEFGLLSETFKIYAAAPGSILLDASSEGIDDSFLDPIDLDDPVLVANSNIKKKKFKRNVGFAARANNASGNGFNSVLFYANTENEVKFYNFNGFQQTSTFLANKTIDWDFVGLNSLNYLYFLNFNFLSNELSLFTFDYGLNDQPSKSGVILSSALKNGATDIVDNNYTDPETIEYRSTWQNDTGYILSSVPGEYNRFYNFYKTTKTFSDEFVGLTKLLDLPGIKEEGQIVSLSQGIYFFNNSSNILVYSPTRNTWISGGLSMNSTSFRALQDINQPNFDNVKNTLLAASDGDNLAYLSYDYSEKSFIKFSEYDTTFTSMNVRPRKDQWNMGVY